MSNQEFKVGDHVACTDGREGAIVAISHNGDIMVSYNGFICWTPAAALKLLEKKPEQTKESEHDPIKRPSHYCVGGYECRDVIEALGLGYYRGNAFKYLWRAGRKGDAIEDLRKAARNIEYEIERLQKHGDGQ